MDRKVLLATALLTLGSRHACAHRLAVTVRSDTPRRGTVKVAVFAGARAFPGGMALARATAKLVAGRAEVNFTAIGPSTVTVAAYLDGNGNGRLDRNWLGRPTEPYGFSNGATGTFGPPRFDAARIDLRRRQRITISLQGRD